MEKPRRNYIRRKRCFNACVEMIAKTLRVIKQAQNEPFTEAQINSTAAFHASQIEAACWAPRSKMSDESYKRISMSKTTELCIAILRKHLRNVDQVKLRLLSLIVNPELRNMAMIQIAARSQMNVAPAPPPPSPPPPPKAPEHVFVQLVDTEAKGGQEAQFDTWIEDQPIGDGMGDMFCNEQVSF